MYAEDPAFWRAGAISTTLVMNSMGTHIATGP
jgi:hypothetical protein